MKNRIGQLLFKKIFIWYIVVAIFLSSAQFYSEYISHKELLSNSLKTVENTFNKALTNAVWNLDEKQINSTIEAIESHENIAGVYIIEPHKSVIAQIGRVSNDENMMDKKIEATIDQKLDYVEDKATT